MEVYLLWEDVSYSKNEYHDGVDRYQVLSDIFGSEMSAIRGLGKLKNKIVKNYKNKPVWENKKLHDRNCWLIDLDDSAHIIWIEKRRVR